MRSSSQTRQAQHSAGEWIRLIAIGVVAGVLVSIVTQVITGLGRKFLALGVLGFGLLAVALISRQGREVFLFAWVVALTYNRQFWSFTPIVGDHGAFGPYWMISDLLLLVLIALWVYEAAVLKRPQHVHGERFLPWYAPFAIVAMLSVVGAPEPAWALGDLARIVKLGLVLLYFRYNVGPREWWVVVAGLGAAVSVQSVFGILEVTTGRTGVLGVLGIGGPDAREVLGIEELFGGWTRATGTVAHPPYLAAFLLLTVPVFMSLAFTLRTGLNRWVCMGVTALGLIGMACTLARLPIVLMMGQTILLVIALVGLRLVPVTRAIAIGAFAGLSLTIFGIITADFIYDRLFRDLAVSVNERFAEYAVAANMLFDHPLFGVGLNNYAAYMQEYGSSAQWGIDQKWHDASTQVTHMRLLAGPLNGYIYVATVTGVVGLVTFLWLALGGLVLGWRAVRTYVAAGRAASLGMIVGMLGLYLHQSLSYSIWIDTVMSVWIVLIGLAGSGRSSPVRAGPLV